MAISDIFDAEVITNGLKHKARTNSIPIAIAATVCRPASTTSAIMRLTGYRSTVVTITFKSPSFD